MAHGKTIDDLGQDAYNRYAAANSTGQNLSDASVVTIQTSQDRNTPVSQSHLSVVLQTEEKNKPFADTSPPPGYSSKTNKAFMNQFVPSLGSTGKIEASIHRLENKIANLKAQYEEDESKGAAIEAAVLNYIGNEIIHAENVLHLLQLILEMSKLKGQIEGSRRSSQKG
ncbi:MAG: DUF5399 family protein [Rhabdochlamydiaceae bacterium]|nr:DUF5399 family protein [Candidatus Amphrikana amoebophyrae]